MHFQQDEGWAQDVVCRRIDKMLEGGEMSACKAAKARRVPLERSRIAGTGKCRSRGSSGRIVEDTSVA